MGLLSLKLRFLHGGCLFFRFLHGMRFLLLEIFPRHGQHQLNAVFLIDPSSAGVVIDGHNIGLGISFP